LGFGWPSTSGGDVVRTVCRQGAKQIVMGIALGFLAGPGVVRMARAALFGVAPNDPLVALRTDS